MCDLGKISGAPCQLASEASSVAHCRYHKQRGCVDWSPTKMKMKHNKKRNTAFLFEALTREYVKAVVKKNSARQRLVKKIIKEL